MTTDAVSQRVSFWRDFLGEFLVFLKTEWRWVLVFSLVLSVGNVVAFAGADLHDLAVLRGEVFASQEKAMEFLNKYGWASIFSGVYASLVKIAGIYIITAVSLHSLKIIPELQLSWRGFFYWFGKIVQKYALLVLPVLLSVFLAVVVKFSGLIGGDSFVGGLVAALLFLGGFSFFYLGLYLLFVVSPLAVLRKKSVIRMSVKLTKDHLWRIFWPSMALLLGLFAAFAPVFLLQWGVNQLVGVYSLQAHVVASFVEAFWEIAVLAASVLYACVVYRALDREQGPDLDEQQV